MNNPFKDFCDYCSKKTQVINWNKLPDDKICLECAESFLDQWGDELNDAFKSEAQKKHDAELNQKLEDMFFPTLSFPSIRK